MSELDTKLVNALGLAPAARRIRLAAAAGQLTPTSRLGTETVARLLGLRVNHPQGSDDLELLPTQPATRAEAAYSFAGALALAPGQVTWVDQLSATFTPPALDEWQRAVLTRALRFVGYPYVWDGTSEAAQKVASGTAPGGSITVPGGFDCSGFVWRVYKTKPFPGAPLLGDILKGRTTYAMSAEVPKSDRIGLAALEPGDVVFFGGRGTKSSPADVGHMGIYVGNGWFVHSSNAGVTLQPLQGSYATTFAWARRPLLEAGLAAPSPSSGSDRACERVARGRPTGLVALREPPSSLLRGAVRPGLLVDLTLGSLLDAVVTDGARGVDPGVDVRLGEVLDQSRLDRVLRPHAPEAVGLELRPHGPALRPAALLRPAQRAHEILDVVAVLVGEDVGLRERAPSGAEPRLQLVEEAEVDVHLLVGRAVEGADLGARGAATGLHRVRVEHRLRGPVAVERLRPVGLDAVDVRHDPAVLPLVCVLPGLAVLTQRRRRPGRDRLAIEAPQRSEAAAVAAREDRVEHENDETDDAEAAAARDHGPAHAAAAHICDLRRVEPGSAAELHRNLLPRNWHSHALPTSMPGSRVCHAFATVAAAALVVPGLGGGAPVHTLAPKAGPTTAALVGQRLVVALAGTRPSLALLGRIRRGEIGGVILFGANITGPAQLRRLTTDLQRAARAGGQAPLLISTDQEGGAVRRVPWAGPELTASQLGASSASVVRREAGSAGNALKAVGVNVDLAPVADVPASGSFMAAQGRTFGTSADVVAGAVSAFAVGLRAAGVAAAVKHFPGIGEATQNTDRTAVEIRSSRADLEAGLVPFRAAIAAGAPIVMVSNASYAALDSKPAPWSPRIQRLLRDELGFQGVTITDALEGAAATRGRGLSSVAVLATQAGVDLLLLTGSEKSSAAVYETPSGRRGAGRDPGLVPPPQLRQDPAAQAHIGVKAAPPPARYPPGTPSGG